MPTTLSDVEAEALGRRWLAAGGVWRDGMLDGLSRVRTHHATGRSAYIRYRDTNWEWVEEPVADTAWPDLRDAATRGAALEVVRERWNAPALQVSPVVATEPDGVPTGIVTAWRYYVNDSEEHFGHADTEPEALVAALEACHAL